MSQMDKNAEGGGKSNWKTGLVHQAYGIQSMPIFENEYVPSADHQHLSCQYIEGIKLAHSPQIQGKRTKLGMDS